MSAITCMAGIGGTQSITKHFLLPCGTGTGMEVWRYGGMEGLFDWSTTADRSPGLDRVGYEPVVWTNGVWIPYLT